MTKSTTIVPVSNIILDEEIYPRNKIDQKRIGIFAENIRDGFEFDPVEVQVHPKKNGKYRILDGAHRWNAYKAAGITEIEVIIKNLGGFDPLLYAASKAIGPRPLNEEEGRETARRAYLNNPGLSSAKQGMLKRKIKDLINAPFTQLHPQGIRGVFKPTEIDEILDMTYKLVA